MKRPSGGSPASPCSRRGRWAADARNACPVFAVEGGNVGKPLA